MFLQGEKKTDLRIVRYIFDEDLLQVSYMPGTILGSRYFWERGVGGIYKDE